MTETTKFSIVQAEDRDEVIARVKKAAFDIGKECEHCGGSGTVRPGRRVVHSTRGFIGADWDEDGVIDAVREARQVWWGHDMMEHDLAVQEQGGGWVKFQVPHPHRPSGGDS